VIEIFAINHAGWNRRIIQVVDPRQYSNRYAVSALHCFGDSRAGFVIYFDRRSQKKTKQPSAG
jgi:hypothetical protein